MPRYGFLFTGVLKEETPTCRDNSYGGCKPTTRKGCGEWRSIFRFSGSKCELNSDFEQGPSRDETYFSNIHEVDLIYLTGGDPKHLLETLYQTPFMAAITESVSKGATLAGSSAGAMVLGSRMRFKKWMPAIGLISNTAVLPHHENSIPETVLSENQSELQSGIELIGIDSATGVFLGDNGVKIAGKGKAIFYSGSTYKIIESAS